jgi:hypothetical protein
MQIKSSIFLFYFVELVSENNIDKYDNNIDKYDGKLEICEN